MRIKAGNTQTDDVQTFELPSDWTLTDGGDRHWRGSPGGSLSAVKYRLVSDGVSVTAYDQTGAVAATGTDGGAVLTAVMPAAASAGATIEFRNDGNVFPWGSVPGLPSGITTKLQISGNGVTVQLSSAARRFLDFKRIDTLSVGSQVLPQGTLNVVSTAGFPASGTIQVGTGGGLAPTELIAYTGLTATSFTGCTTASGATIGANALVELAYDTFKNITVEDFVVDAQSLGGRQHVILGTYGRVAAAGHEYRMNIDQLTIRRVKAINVLVDSNVGTNNRVGIYLVVGQAAASEAVQSSITRVNIEDVRIEGGNYGFTVGGTGIVIAGLNVFIDDINFKRCWHSLMSLQASSFASVNYFIGSRGFGGRCTLEDCYGAYSADVGVEIDAMTDATVERCTIDEARNANFFHTNFTTPQYPAVQMIRFSKCISRRLSTPAGGGHGFSFATAGGPSIALGSQLIEDCTTIDSYAGTAPTAFGVYRSDNGVPAGTFSTKLIIRNLTVVLDSWNYAGGAISPTALRFTPSAGACNTLDADGIHFKINGTVSGTVSSLVCMDLMGTNLDLDIRNIDVDATGFTGSATNTLRIFEIGTVTATTLYATARIKGARWINVGGSTAPFGIIVRSTATLTIPAGAFIRIENCDFLKQVGGTDLSIDATQKAQVSARGNSYHVLPAPTTLTGLATGTGKVLGTGWDAVVTFAQGSGAAITAIDYSTNGGTTYTNFLTQASAALPAGFDLSLGPLPPDALIKVTFTTTQPTINLVPVNP